MKFVFLILISQISAITCSGQEVQKLYSETTHINVDSIKIAYPYVKMIKEYEKQICIALIRFPKFKKLNIKFLYSNTKTTMETRPEIGSILSSTRHYDIYIDSSVLQNNGILLSDAPFNAQIGVIAHEFNHIADYENKSAIEIVKLGFDYKLSNSHRDYETSVDKMTIKCGLGWQLYDWSDFVLNKSKATLDYKTYKRKNYLSPDEIKMEISKCGLYAKEITD